MAEKSARSPKLHVGPVDVFYSPRAHADSSSSEEGCREIVAPVLQAMQQSGVSRVFITQCKRWSCDRRWMCEDTQLDDVLRYTFPHPQEFIGIAGYNPLDIGQSVHQSEIGIKQHGFRGVYVHPSSFGLTVNDRRVYPLYVKALDWHVPVMIDASDPDGKLPLDSAAMEQVAADFPELTFVVAQNFWRFPDLESLLDNCPNVFFCFDAASLSTAEARQFVVSSAGQNHSMWCSNGVPWSESLAAVTKLNFPCVEKLLYENATRVFGLDHLHRKTAKSYVPRDEHLTRIVAE